MDSSDAIMTLKIMICGEGGVGKTAIIDRFTGLPVSIGETPVTIGIDFATHVINTSDRTINLQIWDCGGQEQFRFFLSDFYKGALGSIVVFDLTRYETFKKVDDWLKIIEENAKGIPRILVGNKVDKIETIAVDQVAINSMISKGKFSKYFETSAKTGQNIVKAFAILTVTILKQL